jgi:hypothetical protein
MSLLRMNYKMYLDDLRIPKEPYTLGSEEVKDDHWVVIRSSQEAIDYVIANGPPQEISFDHDLGGNDTSIQFIKWLINYTMDYPLIQFPQRFAVHSANPVGAENIRCMMNNFITFYYGNYDE